jgi:hypothetical protein
MMILSCRKTHGYNWVYPEQERRVYEIYILVQQAHHVAECIVAEHQLIIMQLRGMK